MMNSLSAPVLVTGAGGFIGGRMVKLLKMARVETVGWSRHDVNLLNGDLVREALTALKPATVFHFAAAGVNSARACDSATIGEDVAMVANLLAALPPGARFIFAGSMSEYGRSGVLAEQDVCAPRTAYGVAKLASGLYALAQGERTGVAVQVARLFGVYGAGESARRLFPSVIQNLTAGLSVDLSDGLQARDFIHVDDVCRTMMALSTNTRSDGKIVNVGTGAAVQVRQVAEWIADSIGAPRHLLRFGARARSPGDEDLLAADTRLLCDLLGELPPQRLAPGLGLDLFCV